ncbi:uncharacterized protein AMSG_10230 [Thecamonas trahens ATCC 50062]|uniref:Uncharacterized protein n=1 Tax=Thecamonas trahens ATCC 50062 TaxID=461836 RepID=A0A0L0DU24_THETB|nr:hypothetical protein AMSG_10230 [Thecamonas trahens ATCC 50062]KNC54983.1 hypothetical protein AMSG_10230 [Thecamonas trahens ATCC 50062]|eukprot:XP_013753428.1 hypothetical protein AMSG_10230 [Thecamonas trahens ATCC 50062]
MDDIGAMADSVTRQLAEATSTASIYLRLAGNRLLSPVALKLTDALSPAQGVLVTMVLFSALLTLAYVSLDLVLASMMPSLIRAIRRTNDVLVWRIELLIAVVMVVSVSAADAASPTAAIDDLAMVFLLVALTAAGLNFLIGAASLGRRVVQLLHIVRILVLIALLARAFVVPGTAVNPSDLAVDSSIVAEPVPDPIKAADPSLRPEL